MISTVCMSCIFKLQYRFPNFNKNNTILCYICSTTFMSNMNNYSFLFRSPRLLRTLGPFPAYSFGVYWPTSVAGFPGVVFAILFAGFETKL